ncbi:MAG: efflux RND transporter permease subunit, partial [Pseudomonadota bacterium]
PLVGGNFKVGNEEIRTDGVATYRSMVDVADTQLKNYDYTIVAAPKPPLRLGDIAKLEDGPGEADQYVYFAYGRGGPAEATVPGPLAASTFRPAVTLSVAKLPGTSANQVAQHVLEKVEAQKGLMIPDDVHVEVTRNYGQTATDRSDELLFHMGIAVFSVTLLILVFLGWRESLVVAIAIPITLGMTLSAFYFLGYTLNRVTMFALIFSIGILVDDPIVDVENIVRHLRLPRNKDRAIPAVVIEAVNEVRSPLILASLAVMLAILPMGMVGGLMGPYMRPIPVGAGFAMLLSMIVAFVITPWAATKILKPRSSGSEEDQESRLTRIYRHMMNWLMSQRRYRWLFLATTAVLMLGSLSLFPASQVKVKMLPFDNKNEFQVILDMPEGTPLEKTAAVTREMAAVIAQFDQVRDVEVYAGLASPFNFNGLIRHYYLRSGSTMGDIQVNLIDRHHRTEQSHAIAKKIRVALQPLAQRHGARIKVAEVPPGPPVLETLVAEIYGPDESERIRLVRAIEAIFHDTEGVVDVDHCLLYDQHKTIFKVDREKAALNHIDPEMCTQNLNIGLNGRLAGVLHDPREREQVDIRLQLPEAERSSVNDILALPVRGRDLRFVPLGEMMSVQDTVIDQRYSHKNLKPVSYVIADVAGVIESPAFAIQAVWDRIRALQPNDGKDPGLDIYFASQPFDDTRYGVKWDGEMHVTYEVFRDLGLAFVAALVLIYILMVGWFDSYLTPLIIMAVIPLSLIGILPAHALMGSFFTATSMIGFMAGAGIVVRNSIILVDFIKLRQSQGRPLQEAVVDAGAVRFRPMVLTAAAVVVGSTVILFDPIFQGLAISLMAGEITSLLIGRAAIPILYFMAQKTTIIGNSGLPNLTPAETRQDVAPGLTN